MTQLNVIFRYLSIICLFYAFIPTVEGDEILKDSVHNSSIKSVQFHKTGVETSYPILKMSEDETLTLKFDQMNIKGKNYGFTIIHCTPDWKPSNISKSQYIEGMQTDYLDQFQNSRNTFIPYLHYSLRFPSRNMKPSMSGNYVLKVFEQGNPEKVILTKRFYVVNHQVKVTGEVVRATYARYRNTHHEIDFEVNYKGLNVSDPFKEISVKIRQNWRWDNTIEGLKPSHVNNKQLIYDYEQENLFLAGNEYRRFDTRSVKYSKVGVQKVELDSFFHAYLRLDEGRSFKTHINREDINGQYYIRAENANEHHLGSDYVDVNFFLDPEYSLKPDEAIYVFGSLTNWQILPEFQLEHLAKQDVYHTNALLKQGFYNYHYTVAPKGSQKGDITKIEGSHFETENDYNLFVYYKDRFRGIHKLVGLETMKSGPN